MPDERTHHTGVTSERGYWVGTKDTFETQVIDAEGKFPTITPLVRAEVLKIAHDTTGLATGVTIATMNVRRILLAVHARVTTAWDSGTSAAISVGHGAGLNQYINAQDVKTAGLVTTVAGALPTAEFAAATPIKVKVVTEGETTAGEAEITLVYAQLT